MNKDKRNNIQLLGTLNNADESGIIANANQVYDANEDKSTQDVSKEHKERIETLETKESSMQTTLENIAKTGEASAASNVTYNHNDSKLDATNVQQAIDEVRKKSNYNDGENIIDFNTIHLITDNPEYICVAVDADEKILYGIKTDGQPYFGVGCPQQVKDYIDEQINKILGTNDITTTIDSLKEIEAFLKDFTNSDTLKNLLDLKANVDEVKTTTDDIYKKSNPNDSDGNVVDTNTIISFEDNPEYIKALTDSMGKLIEAIGLDGVRKFFAGINIQGVGQYVTDNPEYIVAWLDAEGKILFGLKSDGKTYVGDADFLANITDKDIDWDVLSSITATENPKYISAVTDSENKILAGRTPDGAAFENIGFSTPKVSIDGHTIENIEDPEGRSEVTTDSEGKIISYRDSDGVKHENAGIETNSLILTDKGMTAFQQALKDSGFISGKGNWSYYISNDGDNPLHLSIPRCAIINITNSGNNAVWPTSKTNNYEYYIEYADVEGNYFKKPIIANAQGNSSMGMPKKNMALDMFDSEWNGDVFSVKFGDWVPQDSFQLKAFYLDLFRCVCPISYKLARQIVRSRGPIDDALWKREMLPVIGTGTTDMSEFTDYNKIFDSGAIGIPDGFPCIAFLNGEFYGVYSFQLKKHRDNYMMSKGNAGHIHLDGCIKDIFEYDGTIDWAVVAGTVADSMGIRDGIEFRNPKNLVYAEAHNNTYKYDADSPGQFEIAGNNDGTNVYDTWEAGSYIVGKIVSHNNHIFMNTIADNTAEPIYHAKNNSDNSPDFKNKTGCGWLNVTNTVAVKSSFIALSTYVPKLAQMVEDHATDSEIKAKIEEHFDVKGLIDYLLLSVVVGYETAGKNWQWITYDGIKWSVCPWDYDGAFGWNGWGEYAPTNNISVNTTGLDTPLGYIYAYYGDVINERYAQLRQLGIFSVDNIWGLFTKWMDSIGADYYGKDLDKWPCDGEHYSGMSGVHYDNKYRLYNWIVARINKCDEIFSYMH